MISAGASQGVWSTNGTGTFSPDNTSLNASYTSTPSDTALGTISMILTSTDNGNCLAVGDTIAINYTTSPFVNAGNDLYLCKNDTAYLSGIVSGGATTGEWSTSGTGIFMPDISTLNASYVPSATDTIAGSVILTLTSTNVGSCIAVTDELNLVFTDRPVVDAGSDINICAGTSATLSGAISGSATSGYWISNGTGIFSPNDSTLNVIYTPSLADISNGTVTLTLVSTFSCPISDQLIINIQPAPVVDAGTNIFICENISSVTLNGSISGGATTGIWTTLGDGIFDDANSMNTIYHIGYNDSIASSTHLILTSTNNGVCNAVSDTIKVTMSRQAIVDAGSDITTCSNLPQVSLFGSVSGGTSTGCWSSNGTGTFIPDSATLNCSYIPSLSDTSLGLVSFTLTSTNNGGCPVITDQVQLILTPAPYVEAGDSGTVCANNSVIHLSGFISGGASAGIWTSSGTGVFSPSANDLSADYIPSQADIDSGYVNLTLISTNNGDCLPVSDSLTYTITSSPIVNAGPNKFVCKGNNVSLHGQVTLASGSGTGIWQTTGDGTFSPNNTNLNVTYIPGQNDTIVGHIFIILTSTNNGLCSAVSDTALITFTNHPFVSAGADQMVCSNVAVQLEGVVSGASNTGVWTGGEGSFSPDSVTLGAIYTPSTNEIQNGSVTLTLSSTNSCLVKDSMTISFQSVPVVSAGSDTIICISENVVGLNGSVSSSTTTGIWTTLGTGTFNPDNTTLNASYLVTSEDSLAGSVQLVLTSTNNGLCEAQSDTMEIFITPVPFVNAGNDTTMCANNVVPLSGTILGIPGTGYWSTSGSGTFVPDSSDFNAEYIFSDADTLNGSVILTLHATGACMPISDDVVVTISPAPYVEAGNDVSVCANNANVLLSGNVWGATNTATWVTNGDGVFEPSVDDLNATYIPGIQDTTNGFVVLYLEATNIGNCLVAKDSMSININSAPVVNAGGQMFICENLNAHLHGSVTGSGTGTWQTDGDGTFSPNDSTLNATYIPGINDESTGLVHLTLTSANNGDCLAVSNVLTLHITPRPTVDAGFDITVCENAVIQLLGSVSGSTTTGYWTTLGNGSFSPDSSDLSAIYLPDSSDTQTGTISIVLTSSNACSVSDTMNITLIPAPVADAGNNQTICQGVMSVDIHGAVTNASSYIWQSSGTGIFIPDNISLNATYQLSSQDSINGTVILTLIANGDAYCQADSDFITISTAGNIAVDAGTDITICESGEVFLSGTANTGTIYWSTLGTGSFAPDSSDLNAQYLFNSQDVSAGSVDLVLNSQTSCGLYTDTLVVIFTPNPVVEAGQDILLCKNAESFALNGIISAGSSTGKWTTNGNGNFLPTDSVLNAEYYLSELDTNMASITFWLTSTNNGSCVAVIDSFTLTFESIPLVNAGNNVNVCFGNNVSLDGQVISTLGTGYWSSTGDGTFNPNATSLQTTYVPGSNDLLNGSLTLILSSDATNICASASDSITVTIINAQSAAQILSEESLCFGDSLFLLPIITGDTGEFAWSSSGSGFFIPDTASVNPVYIPSALDLESGIVEIFMHYHYQCGNMDDTLLLSINHIPTASFGVQTHCADYIAAFSDSSTVNSSSISQWNWDFGDGGTANSVNPEHQYSNYGQYQVSLIVNSQEGCADTVVKQIELFETLSAEFAASDTVPAIGSQVNFTNNSIGALSYYWTFGDNSGNSGIDDPSYTYNAPGEYTVWLYAYGHNGCEDSAYQQIHINYAGYAIPTAFSPNNDGFNDKFFIRGGPFVEYEMRVFNDWGQQVFISNSQTDGWDGTIKGKEAQEGVYVLIFKGKVADGTEVNYSGDITLVR